MLGQPEIPVRIGADERPFRAGVRRAEADAEQFRRRLASGGAMLRTWAVGFALVGAGAVAYGRKVLDVADSIDKASRAASVGAERLQSLRFAAEQSGISTEKMDGALAKFNVTLGRVMSGMETKSSSVAQAFAALGMNIEEVQKSGASTEQMFDMVMTRLAGVEDGAQQAAIAAQLFGRSAGPDMRNLLANGVEGLSDLEDAARDAGAVIDEALITRGVEIADKWHKIMNNMAQATHSFALSAAKSIDNALGFTDSGKMEMLRGQVSDLADERNNLLDEIDFETERMGRAQGGGGQLNLGNLQGVLQATEEELNIVNQQLLDLGAAKQEREARLAALAGGIDPIEGGSNPGSGGGGGKRRSDRDTKGMADRWREQLAQTRMFQDQEFELLTQARDQKLISEEEYQQRLIEMKRKHAEDLAQFETPNNNLDELATRREARLLILQEYEEQELALLADARARGLIAEEEYQQRLTQLTEQYAEARARINRMEAAARVNSVMGAGAEVLGALGAFNDRALRLSKIFGAAQALISTYQGAAEALKLPFPANMAAAAAVAAKGLALVGAIRGVSAGGGGGGAAPGGGGTGAAAAATAPQSAPLQVRFDGMNPGDLYSGASILALLEKLQDEAGDRGLVLSFAQ